MFSSSHTESDHAGDPFTGLAYAIAINAGLITVVALIASLFG